MCCCRSVAKSCLNLCNLMDSNMPGFPVLSRSPGVCLNSCPLIQWCHPTISSSPASPIAFNPSQHQGLVQWVSSSHQVAKVLELQLQHQSFQWICRVDFLWDWLVWSLCCPGDSQESSLALQFEGINSSVLSLLYGPILISIRDYWENHSFDYTASIEWAVFMSQMPCLVWRLHV